MSMRFQSIPWTLIFLAWLGAGEAWACQVPVFRYALERWEPAAYALQVTPGKNGLSTEESRRLNEAKALAGGINLEVILGEPSAEASTAQAVLLPPARSREEPEPVWQGGLEALPGVLDSPARQEVARRLLAGQSAVWVLVESGDAEEDAKAAERLQEGFALALQRLELPDGVITREDAGKAERLPAGAEANQLHSDLPLRLEFSMLRVRRDDPAEQVLVAMLSRVEPDLADFADKPMAFPVFGRGRVLEPLIGAGIFKTNVLEAGGYLCGACSCEIKELNPGMDLLLQADWTPVDTAPKIETVRIVARSQPAPAAKADGKRPVLIGACLLAAGVVFVWMLRGRKSAA